MAQPRGCSSPLVRRTTARMSGGVVLLARGHSLLIHRSVSHSARDGGVANTRMRDESLDRRARRDGTQMSASRSRSSRRRPNAERSALQAFYRRAIWMWSRVTRGSGHWQRVTEHEGNVRLSSSNREAPTHQVPIHGAVVTESPPSSAVSVGVSQQEEERADLPRRGESNHVLEASQVQRKPQVMEAEAAPPVTLDDVLDFVNTVRRYCEAHRTAQDRPLGQVSSMPGSRLLEAMAIGVESAAGSPASKPGCVPTPTLGHLVRKQKAEENVFQSPAGVGEEARPVVVTLHELHRASLLSLLQQLVVYAAVKVSRTHFLQRQPSMAVFLLSPSLYDGWSSLAQRGAKSYLELLAHHHAGPQSRWEWNSLCRCLSAPVGLVPERVRGRDGYGVVKGKETRGTAEAAAAASGMAAVLPLLPSARLVTGGTPSLRLFASTLTAREAFSIIRWSYQFNPEQHISSTDISAVVRRILQESASRAVERSAEETVQLDFLLRCWHSSRKKEVAYPALGRVCGVSHTHYNKARVEGSTLVITTDDGTEAIMDNVDGNANDSSAGNAVSEEVWRTWDFGSTKGLNESLVLGRWSRVLQEILRRLASHHVRSDGDNAGLGTSVHFRETNKNTSTNADKKSAMLALRFLQNDFFGSSEEPAIPPTSVLSQIRRDVTFFMQQVDLAALPLVTQKVIIHKWQLPAVPKALLRALVPSVAEEVLLRHPPTRGLVLPAALRHPPSARTGSLVDVRKGSTEAMEPAGEAKHRAVNEQLVGGEGGVSFLPAAVVQLRRRLWILRHLPPHIPRTLVRFDTTHGDGNNVLPVLDRSPARELLSSLLVSVYALAVSTALGEGNEIDFSLNTKGVGDSPSPACFGGQTECWETLLADTRSAIASLLFHPPHPCYAALNEHCISLFTQLGSTVSSTLFNQYHSVRRHEKAAESQSDVGILRCVLVESTKRFFEPPEPPFYRQYNQERYTKKPSSLHDDIGSSITINEDAIRVWTEWKEQEQEVPVVDKTLFGTLHNSSPNHSTCRMSVRSRIALTRSLLFSPHTTAQSDTGEETAAAASSGDMAVSALVRVVIPPRAFAYLEHKAACLRNFHVSLYLEALSSLAPLPVLLEALAKEVDRFGPPVLAPESAAALLTAFVLADKPKHVWETVAPGRGKNVKRCDEGMSPPPVERDIDSVSVPALLTAAGCDFIFFSVPSDKLHAVSSYFKALFHPRFFQLVVCDQDPLGSSASEADQADDGSSLTNRIRYSGLPEGVVVVKNGWHGAEALLNGRSLRVGDQYPTTTTERFFKISCGGGGGGGVHQRGNHSGREGASITAHFSPPPLRVRYFRLDLQAALAFFREKARGDVQSWTPAPISGLPQPPLESRSDGPCERVPPSPYVVAGKLPFDMYAVYKPAGVNCTLHAHHPSLISFLQDQLPWEVSRNMVTDPPASSATVHTTRSDDESGLDLHSHRRHTVPVVHQHGLVNRVDVGTSGLVLVTTTEASLLHACAATSVHRRVRKYYRALLRPYASVDDHASTYTHTTVTTTAAAAAASLWYLPPRGCIAGHVFANGSDSAVLSSIRHSGVNGSGSSSASVLEDFAAGHLTGPPSTPLRLPVAQLDQRQAFTLFRVRRFFPKHRVYDVEVSLVSGRRHQIRQHFASIGFPLLGDDRYGTGEEETAEEKAEDSRAKPHRGPSRSRAAFYREFLQRPALHACRVAISPREDIADEEASASSGVVVVECPLPEDMKQVLAYLERHE